MFQPVRSGVCWLEPIPPALFPVSRSHLGMDEAGILRLANPKSVCGFRAQAVARVQALPLLDTMRPISERTKNPLSGVAPLLNSLEPDPLEVKG